MMNAPRHLTVRGVPTDLARALTAEARRRGASLNDTVKDLLRRALGLQPGGVRDNGLGSLAGSWSADELEEFERAVAPFAEIDEELWR